MTDLPRIGAGSRVTLHFAIRLEDGTEIDSNFKGAPASFVMGDGNLLPGFEQVLMGMARGDKASHRIAPEQGFGQPNPANIQTFRPDQFDPEVTLEPGLVMTFQDAANTDLPGVIAEVTDRQVRVDFNHPLAGRTLEFDVEIIAVEPAGAAE